VSRKTGKRENQIQENGKTGHRKTGYRKTGKQDKIEINKFS